MLMPSARVRPIRSPRLPEEDAAAGRAQHQCRGEPCEPVAAQRRRVGRPEQALGNRERCDRHQTEFHTIEHQPADGGKQHRIASAG